MEAKLNAKKVTQAMFEKCFKFADVDKDDPFYMAVKPTANEKKVYAKYLAEKLVEGNSQLDDHGRRLGHAARLSCAFSCISAYFYALVRNRGALPCGVM